MRNMCHSRSTSDNEKLSLRGGQQSISNKLCFPIYVIRSRQALTVFTRLVFAVTILTGILVIFASIWFMIQCRENFRRINALIPPQSNFCTNLGMQALFACCVLLFTIFGFGCIGRRMTGHAILIISGVAIFQGAMTATFYQCRAMSNKDILKAVNSTIESCRVGKSTSPFTTIALGSAHGEGSHNSPLNPLDVMKMTSLSMDNGNENIILKEYVVVSTTTSFPKIKYAPNHVPLLPTVPVNDKQKNDREGVNSLKDKESRSNSSSKLINHMADGNVADSEYNNAGGRRKATGVINEVTELGHEDRSERGQYDSNNHVSNSKREKEEGSLNTDHRRSLASMLQSKEQAVKCEEKSNYFKLFVTTHQRNEIETCLKVCQTYKTYCINRDSVIGGNSLWIDGPLLPHKSATTSSPSSPLTTELSSSAETLSNGKFKDKFYNQTLTCGEIIASQVRQFCLYDNQIFMPMSIGTPVFYMLMSFCFIYLAYCDRQLKDNGELLEQHESFMEAAPRSSSFSSNLSRPKVRTRPRSHSVSREVKELTRQHISYSSWSPFRPASRQDRAATPSPADSEVCSRWDGHTSRQLDEDLSPQMSLQSCSTKTSDTFLSID